MGSRLIGFRKALTLALFGLGILAFVAGFGWTPLAACNFPNGCDAFNGNSSLSCKVSGTNNTEWCVSGDYNCEDYPAFYLWSYICYSTQEACTNIYTNTVQYCGYCTGASSNCCYLWANEPGCYYKP